MAILITLGMISGVALIGWMFPREPDPYTTPCSECGYTLSHKRYDGMEYAQYHNNPCSKCRAEILTPKQRWDIN